MSTKHYKFQFYALVKTVKLNLKFECQLSVMWKRGEKVAEVNTRREIVNGVATFNESISIQCNMDFDPTTKSFACKKTLMSVLIFTEKGTKQAGEIELDVSQILNKQIQQHEYELSLAKCPDKNASIKFVLRFQAKEEIKTDNISQASFGTVDLEKVAGTVHTQVANFKKKQKVEEVVGNYAESSGFSAKILKSQTLIKDSLGNTDEKIKNLEEQNKRLREDLKQAKKQQDKLKKQADKSTEATEEWKKKCQFFKKQFEELKASTKDIKAIQKQNKMLETEVLTCRYKLANIFNFAFDVGGPQLADQLQEASGYVQNKR